MRLMIPLLLVTAVAACSDDPVPEPFSVCDDFETPHDDVVAGLAKAGENGRLQVRLLEADPAPPAKGDNSWTVQILDDAGAPAPGAQIVDVTPLMPEHDNHGTSIEPMIDALDAEARATVESVDFRMAGVWTLTFELETAAGEADRVVFGVCIEG